MDNAVALAAIGLVGTILAIVVKPLFSLLRENTKALNLMADSNREIALETRKGNKEAKQRNGHLGEQNIQITRLIVDQNDDVGEILTTLKSSAATLKSDTKEVKDTLRDNTEIVALATQTVADTLKGRKK